MQSFWQAASTPCVQARLLPDRLCHLYMGDPTRALGKSMCEVVVAMHGSETWHVLHMTCHACRQKKAGCTSYLAYCQHYHQVAYLSTRVACNCRQGYKVIEASSPAHAPARVGAGRPGMLRRRALAWQSWQMYPQHPEPSTPQQGFAGRPLRLVATGSLIVWRGMRARAQHADACPKKRGARTRMAQPPQRHVQKQTRDAARALLCCSAGAQPWRPPLQTLSTPSRAQA